MDTVLVVEDYPVLRETLVSYLRSRLKNHRVLTAEDGAQAVEILETRPISAVLTDLEMPNIDGYKVMAYVKQMRPTVPLIIMTGIWSLDLRMLVQKLGNVKYLAKPCRLEEVERLVVEPLLKKERAGKSSLATDQAVASDPCKHPLKTHGVVSQKEKRAQSAFRCFKEFTGMSSNIHNTVTIE